MICITKQPTEQIIATQPPFGLAEMVVIVVNLPQKNQVFQESYSHLPRTNQDEVPPLITYNYRWWFKYLLFSPCKIGEDGTQLEYVSKWVGEKPPTSFLMNPGTSDPMASMYGISIYTFTNISTILKTSIHGNWYIRETHLPQKSTIHVGKKNVLVSVFFCTETSNEKTAQNTSSLWQVTALAASRRSAMCPRSHAAPRRARAPRSSRICRRRTRCSMALGLVGNGWTGWRRMNILLKIDLCFFQIFHKVETQFCNVFFLEMMYWHM